MSKCSLAISGFRVQRLPGGLLYIFDGKTRLWGKFRGDGTRTEGALDLTPAEIWALALRV